MVVTENIADTVAFKYLRGVVRCDRDEERSNEPYDKKKDCLVISFIQEMDNLGYRIAKPLYEYLMGLSMEKATEQCLLVLGIAKDEVGFRAKPSMYKGFPEEVISMLMLELELFQLAHYFSAGTWFTGYSTEERAPLDEEVGAKTDISLITLNDVKEFFFVSISSKTSIPLSIGDFVTYGIENGWVQDFKGVIEFKETLCRVAVHQIKSNFSIVNIAKTTTDVLRVVVALSGGDIELKNKRKTRIGSFPRQQRRIIVEALENVINVNDIKSYGKLWKLVFHSLHIGEFKGTQCSRIAKRLRNTKNIVTLDTEIFEAIKAGDVIEASKKLRIKPSVFARNLDKLMRTCKTSKEESLVLESFSDVGKAIGTKVLLQLLGHFQNRDKPTNSKRVIVTAGLKGKVLQAPELPPLSEPLVQRIIEVIEELLIAKLRDVDIFDGKKNIFISPKTSKILLPLQLASITENKKTVNRGSRFLFDIDEEDSKKNFLRLFIYWVGKDVDLSAKFANEDLTEFSHVSYSQLKSSIATHSGDITDAPNGASEYIDLNISRAIDLKYRYMIMSIFVYKGPNFIEHDTCFAGYMLREKPQRGEVFEPSTVKNKFDITSDTKRCIPIVFDLQEREIIWIDADLDIYSAEGSINIELNTYGIIQTLKGYLAMHKNRVAISKLIDLHVRAANALIVDSQDEADFVVGLGEGDLDVFNFSEMNSKWI